MTIVDTCVKNRGTSSSLDRVPSSLVLQGGGALAKHPLSFHPQEVCLAAEKKRESGEKKKREGKRELKASPKIYCRSD